MEGQEIEDDPIKVWQDPQAYPSIPDHIILCPLSQEDTKHEFYSLTHQGVPSFYLNQERVLKHTSLNKSLTMAMPTSPSRMAKTTMAPLSPSTLEMRVRVMREFIGFCVKWLHLPATMEHVLNPQVVSKYIGFHLAKGNTHGTINLYASHLHQVASTFASTTRCPKMLTSIESPSTQALMDWYTNLNGKLLASSSSHYKAKSTITLWSVWEACLTKWSSFQAKFKVGEGGAHGVHVEGVHQTHNQSSPHSPTMAVGPQGQVDQGACKGVPRVCALHDGGGHPPATHEGGGLEGGPQLLLHQGPPPMHV